MVPIHLRTRNMELGTLYSALCTAVVGVAIVIVIVDLTRQRAGPVRL